jgi:hypothetical protein
MCQFSQAVALNMKAESFEYLAIGTVNTKNVNYSYGKPIKSSTDKQ